MAAPLDIGQMKKQYFDSRRSEAQQQANAFKQEGEDALNRRFAALGSSGSGAAIAANMKNREMAGDAQRKALGDVNNQELQSNISDAEMQRQSAESEKQRGFQKEMANQDLGFKREVFGSEQGNKLKEFDLAERQFALDKDTTEFNKAMAAAEAGQPPPKSGLGQIGGQISKTAGDVAKAVFDPLGSAVGIGKQILGGGK